MKIIKTNNKSIQKDSKHPKNQYFCDFISSLQTDKSNFLPEVSKISNIISLPK